MIYGAIIGDVAGSEWEFDALMKQRPEELITDSSFYTDDTVMTIAVADAIMHSKPYADTMKEWAHKYHKFKCGGYGSMFIRWLATPGMPAYGSFGNGAAMRISPAGWAEDTLEDTLGLAEQITVVSHNHPEGVKGAKATVGAIFLARNGYNKSDIKSFLEGLGYDLSRTCDEIRPKYYHDESCQKTIPEAMTAFLESRNFADCLELGISLGGDADTLCAIAGAVAEAFYGVPTSLIAKCRDKLPDEFCDIIDEFESEGWRK